MAKTSFILTFALTIPAVFGVAVVEPFLSLPGNQTVVAFLDLHRSYHDNGTCADPDWSVFELAYSLEWKISLNPSAGIEIYDTCGSVDRTLKIIRDTVLQERCIGKDTPEIIGVLSYVSSDVGELINATANLQGLFYVDIKHAMLGSALKESVMSLMYVLNQTGWTYVTTMVDTDELAQAEHTKFLNLAKEERICIQYTITTESSIQIEMSEVKTPGIVVFTSDLSNVGQFMKGVQPEHGVIILAHDRKGITPDITNKMLILTDGFQPMDDFSNFMMEALSHSTNRSSRLKDYVVFNHNCTWNATHEHLTCKDRSFLEHFFLRRSSELDINKGVEAVDTLLGGALNTSEEENSSSRIYRTAFSLSAASNGVIQKNMILSDSSTINPGILEIINTENFTFPTSHCTGWCPSCKDCQGHVTYDGEFYHMPGDILVTGLFPVRKKGEGVFDCGPVAFNEFSDIYAEAFLYALESSQRRSPGLLPNVTIGGLVFDTCSNTDLITRTVLNFESCLYSFETAGNEWAPSPQIVPGYAVPHYEDSVGLNTFDGIGKLGIAIHPNGDLTVNNKQVYISSRFNYSAVVQLLKKMDWSFVGVITSLTFDNFTVGGFIDTSLAQNICIAYRTEISASNEKSIVEAIETVKEYPANVVIFFATSDAISAFFRTLTYKPVNKVWILVETRQDYLDFSSMSPPPGAIIFQQKSKQNTQFNQHYAADDSVLFAGSPWKAMFEYARDSCVSPSCKREMPTTDVWMRASDIIKSVDIILSAVHNAYIKLCPGAEELCPMFLESGINLTAEEIKNVDLDYQDEIIRLSDPDTVLAGYAISNVQSNGLVQIGSWSTGGLVLDKKIIKFYTVNGGVLDRIVDSRCYSDCQCVNNYTVENVTQSFPVIQLDPEMGFVTSSAIFDSKLWTIITVIIALSGCLITLLLMIYIMCKVCAGALIRRYLVLGLLLLVAMIFLFLSVLPFVFTPSEAGCGMRFFAHGFSYAFSYAIILTKMTTLRDYKYIGLGGEVSRLNQILSVFFITGVQIAMGVEWWVLKGSMLIQMTIKEITTDGIQDVTYYACDFHRKDFITYHCYVLLLLVMCCLYSITVRKETKNMKEARLLLVCSWFCLALWIALIVTFLVLKRDYLEAIAAIGILANALSMMVIIYLPKLTAIARLKYEVSEKKGRRNENGYKIDTDFQFERPYSLPGTMHSTFTDKTTTLPRSLAAFDNSLSY